MYNMQMVCKMCPGNKNTDMQISQAQRVKTMLSRLVVSTNRRQRQMQRQDFFITPTRCTMMGNSCPTFVANSRTLHMVEQELNDLFGTLLVELSDLKDQDVQQYKTKRARALEVLRGYYPKAYRKLEQV